MLHAETEGACRLPCGCVGGRSVDGAAQRDVDFSDEHDGLDEHDAPRADRKIQSGTGERGHRLSVVTRLSRGRAIRVTCR